MSCPRCTSTELTFWRRRFHGRVCPACGFGYDPAHYMSSLRAKLMRDNGFSLL